MRSMLFGAIAGAALIAGTAAVVKVRRRAPSPAASDATDGPRFRPSIGAGNLTSHARRMPSFGSGNFTSQEGLSDEGGTFMPSIGAGNLTSRPIVVVVT